MLITSLHFYDSIFIKWTDSAWLHRPWRTSRTQRPSTTQHWGSGAPADPGRPRVQGFKRSEGSEVFLKCAMQWRKGRKCEIRSYVPRTKQQMVGGRRWQKCCLKIQDFGLYGSLNFIKSVCDPLWPPWLKLPNIGTWCDCVVLAVKFVRNTKHNYVCTHVHCTYGFEIIESS